MRKKRILRLILALIFLIMGLGIMSIYFYRFRIGVRNDSGKAKIVTSFYPLYYFASQIGGDKWEVQNLTPAGVEPHDYEPTAREIAGIEDARLLVLNGGGLESWGAKVKGDLVNSKTRVLEAGSELISGNDPHVWLSPELAKKEAQTILAAITHLDPANAAYYFENGVVLNIKLSKLQAKYKQGLANCAKKEMVTSHAAFGYLAKEFGLTQIAIAGLSPDAEPSTKKLAEIAGLAKSKGIKYIFFESLVSPKLAETLASEIGAKELVLDPLEGISNNDLAQGKNYLTQMEQNLANLRIALECR